jgi:hypothetical protein
MNVTVLKYVPTGVDGKPRDSCDGCGDAIWSEGALKVAGIPGLYCGVGCVETYLFGADRCRWCGSNMEDRQYTSIDSRLCSEDCSESYYTYVRGDRTAALGTGKRFLIWLHAHQPATYQKLANVPDLCELETRRAA